MKKQKGIFLIWVLMLSVLMLSLSLTGCNSGTPSSSSRGSSPEEIRDLLSQEISGEITVSCYDTMTYKSFLDEAARSFEAQYPGTKVHVETFSSMPEIKTAEQGNTKMMTVQDVDDPQGRADYINKVNASLMSGSGADVLAMDVLPVQKYADSGQLENLAVYMEADPSFERTDYRENILEAITYLDGAWFLPLDYSFNYYAYDSTLLSGQESFSFGLDSAFTAEQLIEMAKPLFRGENKLFSALDYVKSRQGGMFNQLLQEQYSYFVDLENKKANFNDGSFVKLLQSVKEYGELGYIPQGVTMQTGGQVMMQHSQEQPTDRYFFKPKNNFSLMQQYNRNSGRKMNIMAAGSVTGLEDNDEVAGIQADKKGQVPFTFTQAYGINADSPNKQTAWAFLKFLLSEKTQLSTNLSPMGLPLHNAARQQKAELLLSGAFMGRGGEPLDEAQRQVLQQYSAAVEKISNQINRYSSQDTIVNDIIAAEVQYFFDGTKSAEEVAKILQNKADLYLSE